MHLPSLLIIDVDSLLFPAGTTRVQHDFIEYGTVPVFQEVLEKEIHNDSIDFDGLLNDITGTSESPSLSSSDNIHVLLRWTDDFSIPRLFISQSPAVLSVIASASPHASTQLHTKRLFSQVSSHALSTIASSQQVIPKEVVVVTGAAAGVNSGKDAGMTVVAIAGGYDANQLQMADFLVNEFGDPTLRQLFHTI